MRVKHFYLLALLVMSIVTHAQQRIRRIIINEDYFDDETSDIALLELSTPLVFSSTKKAINISTAKSYSYGTIATVSGWGRRSVNGSASTSQLYKANITIQSCSGNQIIATVSNNMAYKGDSGGPLTISSASGDMLIGLVKGGRLRYPNSANEFLY